MAERTPSPRSALVERTSPGRVARYWWGGRRQCGDERVEPTADENGSEVAVVQVHPDAESMEFHMEVVRERAARAYAETLEATTGIQVFGPPSAAVVSMLRQQAGAGIPLSSKANHLGGFTRATT